MAWQIEFDASAIRDLKKLDQQTRRRIMNYFRDHIGKLDNPRERGKPLVGRMSGYWRYRIGNYRAICSLQKLPFPKDN